MRKQHVSKSGPKADTTLIAFTEQSLSPDQLLKLKGGDGEGPPADPNIGGHEDIVDL